MKHRYFLEGQSIVHGLGMGQELFAQDEKIELQVQELNISNSDSVRAIAKASKRLPSTTR